MDHDAGAAHDAQMAAVAVTSCRGEDLSPIAVDCQVAAVAEKQRLVEPVSPRLPQPDRAAVGNLVDERLQLGCHVARAGGVDRLGHLLHRLRHRCRVRVRGWSDRSRQQQEPRYDGERARQPRHAATLSGRILAARPPHGRDARRRGPARPFPVGLTCLAGAEVTKAGLRAKVTRSDPTPAGMQVPNRPPPPAVGEVGRGWTSRAIRP